MDMDMNMNMDIEMDIEANVRRTRERGSKRTRERENERTRGRVMLVEEVMKYSKLKLEKKGHLGHENNLNKKYRTDRGQNQ